MAIAVIPFMAVFGTFYFLRKKKNRRAALFCKAAATFMPVLLLVCSFSKLFPGTGIVVGNMGTAAADGNTGEMLYAYICTLAALVFYMAADVLLECKFVWGAVCFSAGHICVTAGFVLGGEVSAAGKYAEKYAEEYAGKTVGIYSYGAEIPTQTEISLLLGVCFLLSVFLAAFFLRKYIPHLKKLLVPAVLYILILSVMCSAAVVSGTVRILETGNAAGLIPIAGGVFFLVSDILLGINRLGRKRSKVRGAAVLILYYLSVYLLAVRLFAVN